MEEIKKSKTALMTKEKEDKKEDKKECDIPRTTIEMLEQTLQIA